MLEKLLFPLRQGISRLALVGLLAFGCGAEQDYAPCTSNNDCLQGRVCLQGECQEPLSCGNGQCENYLQENCFTCPTDCGKCKELCDLCSTDADCWNGQGDNRCIKDFFESFYYNGKGICGKECASSEGCPSGYLCWNFQGTNQCYPRHQSLHFPRVPLCPNGMKCNLEGIDWSNELVDVGCSGSKIVSCDADLGLSLSFDCALYGLECKSDYVLMDSGSGGRQYRCYGASQKDEPCKSDFDCNPEDHGELFCENNQCVREFCLDSNDCASGLICVQPSEGFVNEMICVTPEYPCNNNQDCFDQGMKKCTGFEGHRFCI